MIDKMIQFLIACYFKRRLGWDDKPVIIEHASYEKLIQIGAEYVKLRMQLASSGYDLETGDTYDPKYEQEFAELDEDGKFVSTEDRPKKEDMN